jgi:hypothetical protein
MVGGLAHQGVDKVGTTKSTRHKGVDVTPIRCADLDIAADVRENLLVAEIDQS